MESRSSRWMQQSVCYKILCQLKETHIIEEKQQCISIMQEQKWSRATKIPSRISCLARENVMVSNTQNNKIKAKTNKLLESIDLFSG